MATSNINTSRKNAILAQQDALREGDVFWSKDHRHHSARALLDRRGNTLQINFSGAISQASIDVLEWRLLPDRRGASVTLEYFDTALTMYGGPVTVDPFNFPSWTPPAAVIVREDQFERQQEFCRQLLMQQGVIRVPFLTSQLEWAQAYVARVAARAAARSH